MSTDRARINGQNVTCYFREKDVHDPQSAAGLIVRIAGMEGFEARYIALRDLDGDPGQDNTVCARNRRTGDSGGL